jgi:outer membrane lipoprotein-sorting protein
MRHPFGKLTVCVLLAGLALSGCISRKTTIPVDERLFPAESRTRAELLQDLEKRSQAISTLAAKVALDVSGGGNTGVLTEYRETTGIIQVDRPKQVRLQIQAPVISTTVVDMVSDGSGLYKVNIPVKNKFMVGDTAAPPTSTNALLNLRPQHILDALFVDIQPYLNKPGIQTFLEEVTDGRSRYYVLHFVDISDNNGRLLEKVWVDRTILQATRKQIFREDGVLETDVQFSEYESISGMPFPRVISIRRPIEDYNVKITFQLATLRLNTKLADNAFRLEQPAGSELVQIEKPGPGGHREE